MEQIDYREALDRNTFLRDYLKPQKPVIIRDAINHWFDENVWQFDWLSKTYENLTVNLRFPSSHEAVGFKHKTSTLGTYIEQLAQGKTVDECGYLASLDLPQLPALKKIARFPDYCWIDRLSGSSAWLGPAGTDSVLHCDLLDNTLAQVKGRKLFQMYMPHTIKPFGPRQFNSLTVHPDDRDTPPDFEFVLEEGELLYIPPYYWHRVLALDASISVNQTWYTPKTALRDARIVFHSIYKRAACKLGNLRK
jgi:ribosomal protein L16 Arg81 hydroxylase